MAYEIVRPTAHRQAGIDAGRLAQPEIENPHDLAGAGALELEPHAAAGGAEETDDVGGPGTTGNAPLVEYFPAPD